MNKNNLYFLTLSTILTVNAAFGWSFNVQNLTQGTRPVNSTYAGSGWAFGKCFSCCDDNVAIGAGSSANFDAKGCLLTSINTPGGSSYTSSGQSTYTKFYIIGPIDGSYKVIRIVED